MPATAGARSNDDPSSMNSQENSKVFRFGNALPSRQSTMRSAASQDHNRIRGLRHRAPTSMVGTNTSQTHSSIPFRQHSLSEGSSKAAVKNRVLLMQLSLASTSSYRITEPYMRTSDGVVFQDKKFQRKIAAKVERLIETALSPKSTERNALIAKKALKYREKRSRRPNLTTLGNGRLRLSH